MAGAIRTQATTILDMVNSWSEIPNTLITWITPVLVLGLTISIMWHGYKIVRGAGGQDHLLDVFFNSLRVFLVFSLCLVAGTYASNVVAMVNELRESLTGLFSGTAADIYTQLDTIINQSSDAYKKILDYGLEHLKVGVTGSDLTGLIPMIGGTFMVGFIVLYAFVAAINMIVIDFSLAVFFSLGPLFIASLAFQVTTQFFNTWLSSLLKYVFTAVVISAIVGLGVSVMQGYSFALFNQPPETLDYAGQTFGAVLNIGILIYLTFRAAQVGADLAGGVAVQLGSLAQAARWTINPAGAALSSAGKVAGAGAGYIAGKAGAAMASSAIGKTVGTSSAMKYAMAGVNAMSRMGGGARSAMSHRSMASAMRAGFQSGGSSIRGTGTISK
jgi:type IV secretion system protein VirB6